LVAGQLGLRRTISGRVRGHAQKTGGYQTIEIPARKVSRDGGQEFIAGQLLRDEFVERTIFVERADDVIAIAPGPRTLGIGLHATIGVGVPSHIEPVTSPALPIGRRIQEPIHQAFITRVGGILEEHFDLFWSRRKPCQIKGDSADQLLGSRGLGESEPFLLQASQQIGVDGCSNSFGRSDLGWLGMPHWLESPESALFFGDDPTRHLQWFGAQCRSSLRNPPLDERHLLR